MNAQVSYRDLALTALGCMKKFVAFFSTFKPGPQNNLKATMLIAEFVNRADYMERAIKVLDDREAREFINQVERDLNGKDEK